MAAVVTRLGLSSYNLSMNQIGFIILSHANPRQTIRLARRLQNMYDNPPVVCHHDFGQSPISLNEFPSDVRVVMPYVKTGWGKYSVIFASIKSIEIMYRDFSPDWFVVLSGADYPALPADKVLEDFSSGGMDAYLDFREVPDHPPTSIGPLSRNPMLRHFDAPSNLALALETLHRSNSFGTDHSSRAAHRPIHFLSAVQRPTIPILSHV